VLRICRQHFDFCCFLAVAFTTKKDWSQFLVRSAKLPTGLYILLALIFFFFLLFNDLSETNYLRIRWTNFRNPFTEWKRFGCRWSIWPLFRYLKGHLGFLIKWVFQLRSRDPVCITIQNLIEIHPTVAEISFLANYKSVYWLSWVQQECHVVAHTTLLSYCVYGFWPIHTFEKIVSVH